MRELCEGGRVHDFGLIGRKQDKLIGREQRGVGIVRVVRYIRYARSSMVMVRCGEDK